MQNQNRKELKAENQKQKTKQEKKGKVAEVYSMQQKGASVKEIARKMKLDERIVRSYIWRAKNPQQYRALLKRYYEKKKAKLSATKLNEKV